MILKEKVKRDLVLKQHANFFSEQGICVKASVVNLLQTYWERKNYIKIPVNGY